MKPHAWTIVPMLRRILAVVATTQAAMTTANATVIRFDFTGTVTRSDIGDPVGNVLTGWVLFDTTFGEVTTYPDVAHGRLDYYGPGSPSYSLAGQWAVAGGSSGSVGDSGYFFQSLQIFQVPSSSPSNPRDQYSVNVFEQAGLSDSSNRQTITLNISQKPPPSGIFDAPYSLDLDQHVNWFNPGALRSASIGTSDGNTSFALRTITTSIDGAVRECQEIEAGLCDPRTAEVPEPGTLALLGAALGALAVVGRRKPRA